MMRNGKAPTISDIAREAGVSRFTVSVVLNGARSNTRVSDATRQRILDSARSLRYQPNASARNLARRCTSTLGVLFGVVPSASALNDNYASGILAGIVARSAARRYDVMLYTEPWRTDDGRPAERYRDRRTDGIVLVAPLTDSQMLEELAASAPSPLVTISSSPEQATELGVACVDVDNARGIALAVEHLAALGHTRFAHLTGNANVYSADARRAGFLTALDAAGLPARPEYVVSCTYKGDTAATALQTLMALPEPPTAVIAGNDNLAISVLQAARDLGLCVPDDLSVVGFDDMPAAAQVTPTLTTVRQPLRAIGAAAADLLIDAIEAQRGAEAEEPIPVPPPLLLEPELVVRASTAPPAELRIK